MEKQKQNILNFFSQLNFDEEKHKYSVGTRKIKYSVSGLIKRFVKPFDSNLMSLLVAQKRGISQKEVLAEWEEKKIKACNLGNKTHLFGEKYPFDRTLVPEGGHEVAVTKFWNSLPFHIIPVTMELQMYHKIYFFAGTADIILYNILTDTFIIADYKTNEDLFKNYKGQKLLGIFKHLLDNPFNKYQIQLSFYQILLEQTGVKVSSRKIIYLKPEGNFEMYDAVNFTEELKTYIKENESKI